MEETYIPIGKAAKMLDRSINGVRHLIQKKLLRMRWTQQKTRKVRSICLEDVKKLKPLMPKRVFVRKSGTYSKMKDNGYLKIFDPRHPRAMCDGYVYEHWLVAEKKLKRPLKKQEHVHHINRIRDDNRPENLLIYSSRGAHMKAAHNQLGMFLSKTYEKEESFLRCPHCDKIIT